MSGKIKTYKMGDESVVISTKPMIKNSKITVKTLTTKGTYNNLKKGNNDELEPMEYDDVKAFVAQHTELFHGKSRYQINVLTSKGWRAGFVFKNPDNIDWYDNTKLYKDVLHEIDTVFAIQILLF